jgi:hypothetical protein
MTPKMQNRMTAMPTLAVSAIAIVASFFIISAFLMLTWNYAVPRLLESADRTYDRHLRFRDIEYPTAMVVCLLFFILFRTPAHMITVTESTTPEQHVHIGDGYKNMGPATLDALAPPLSARRGSRPV